MLNKTNKPIFVDRLEYNYLDFDDEFVKSYFAVQSIDETINHLLKSSQRYIEDYTGSLLNETQYNFYYNNIHSRLFTVYYPPSIITSFKINDEVISSEKYITAFGVGRNVIVELIDVNVNQSDDVNIEANCGFVIIKDILKDAVLKLALYSYENRLESLNDALNKSGAKELCNAFKTWKI